MKSTNYFNTLIQVADDCPAKIARVPSSENKSKTVAALQYEMIAQSPYKFTSDEIIFKVYANRNEIEAMHFAEEKKMFFSKGQACLRTSPLAKRYGWGIHSNEEGKVALYAVVSVQYQKLVKDKSIAKTKAMRTKRVDK